MSRPIRRAAVVVPVHDEESTLEPCLLALFEAIEVVRVPVRVVVVLDTCRDTSGRVAASFAGVEALAIGSRNVGRARRAGMGLILADRSGWAREDTWLATTDADSVAPTGWLARQLSRAEEGYDLHVGTVAVDFDGDGATPARRRFETTYGSWRSRTDATTHPHVHGANLGVRASTYADAGGFSGLACHEDRDLVDRLSRRRGTRSWRTEELPVLTSARSDGRAPGGMAADLSPPEGD